EGAPGTGGEGMDGPIVRFQRRTPSRRIARSSPAFVVASARPSRLAGDDATGPSVGWNHASSPVSASRARIPKGGPDVRSPEWNRPMRPTTRVRPEIAALDRWPDEVARD